MNYTNKRVLLAQRPAGLPTEDTWTHDVEQITDCPEGYFIVEHHFISLDPAMRGWLKDRKSYLPPVGIGEVMRAGSAGKVIVSKNDKFPVGQLVTGYGGVQQYAVSDGANWYPTPLPEAMLPKSLGVLGMPGFTGYFGILEVGKIKEGDTVLVSGGSGAVGSVVGQIAKIKGCRVVGIAGGSKKCAYMKETLGFDEAIDYKAGSVAKAIHAACPKGVDVYFDNVGGEILDAALANITFKARVVICGAISQYNETKIAGPANYLSLLVQRATMEGFVIIDYTHRFMEAAQVMGGWMQEGKLKSQEDVYQGIENFNETFLRLFSGEKLGKLILQVKY